MCIIVSDSMMGCITITTLCILVNTVLGGDIVQELTNAGIQDSAFNILKFRTWYQEKNIFIDILFQVFSIITKLSLNFKYAWL